MNLQDVILKPVVTEKAEALREKKCFIFQVSSKANKNLVSFAIQEIYGITPKKINIVNIKGKRKNNRFGQGIKPAKKKAYVFLKENDNIQLFEV